MLYDIDSFGFVPGYVPNRWQVMSEQDIQADRRLARRLYEAKYQVWKRYNINELHECYKRKNSEYGANFERFCRELFRRI